MDVVLSVSSSSVALLKDGTAVGADRDLGEADVTLLEGLSARYATVRELGAAQASIANVQLLEIGRELYGWLDGRQGWLGDLRRVLLPPFLFEIRAPLVPDRAVLAVLRAPWEVLANDRGFLAADSDLGYAPFRRLGEPVAPAKRPQLPAFRLGIAAMASAPRGQRELDYEAEESAIQNAAGSGVDLVVEESGDPAQLGERLSQINAKHHPTVLHLSCHGDDDWRPSKEAPRRPVLMMEDATGNERPTNAQDLIAAIKPYRPHLLFVSACLTASAAPGSEGSAQSMVEMLVRHVPAVLGWDGSVADVAATAFAQVLYGGLARKMTVAEAVAAARQALLNGIAPAWEGGAGTRDATTVDPIAVLLNAPGIQKANWHLARVWLGPEGGGPVVGGTARRSLLPPSHVFKQILVSKGDDQLVVPDPALFVGRRREIQASLKVLVGDDHVGVLLHGMGRLGKTSLAARLASRRPDLKLAVVYGRYLPQDILAALAEALATCEQARSLLDTNRDAVRNNAEALETTLIKLLSGPCAQSDVEQQPVLLLIDDLERILEADPQGGRHRVRAAERPTLRAVLRAFARSGTRSRLVLTSRFPFTLVDGDVELTATLAEIQVPPFSDGAGDKLRRRQVAVARREVPDLTDAVLAGRRELLWRAQAVARGNPGLQDLLGARLVLRPSVPVERVEAVLAEMEVWLWGGTRPQDETVRATLENMAVEALLDLAGGAERALLRAMLLFQLPVPETGIRHLADQIGGSTARLRDLGLLDRFEDLVDPQVPALAANRLVADRLTPPSAAEQAGLAKLVVEDLFAAWGGADGRLSRPYAVNIELTRLGLLAEDGAVVDACVLNAVWGLKSSEPRAAGELGDAAIVLLEREGRTVPFRLLAWTAAALQTSGNGAAAAEVLARGGSRLAEIGPEDETSDFGHYLIQLGDLQMTKGDLDGARATFERGCALAKRLGEETNWAIARGRIADILKARGDLDAALKIRQEEELPVYERLGDERLRAVTMGDIADILQARGDLDGALKIRQEEQLPVYEHLGDVRARAVTMGKIADILKARGDLDGALKILQEEELPVYERLDDSDGIAAVRFNCAQILLAKEGLTEGNAQAIIDDLAESFSRLQKSGRADALVAVGGLFGQVLAAVGQFDEAIAVLDVAVAAADKLGRAKQVAQIRALQDQIRQRKADGVGSEDTPSPHQAPGA
ncbi:CHAT domain-containing protein [Magnetospirillum fulvum]|nr:CHAT domain-containing protein [Magnetospirillum fulvum]